MPYKVNLRCSAIKKSIRFLVDLNLIFFYFVKVSEIPRDDLFIVFLIFLVAASEIYEISSFDMWL